MKLLHLSDLHFRLHYPLGSGYQQLFAKISDPLFYVRKALRIDEFDGILITGDLCEEGSLEDYQALYGFFKENCPDKPLFAVCGNHDRHLPFSKVFGQKESAEPFHFVHDLDGWRIIGFDTSSDGVTDGVWHQSELDWLAEVFQSKSQKGSVLLTHHPLIPGQSVMPSLPQNIQFETIMKNSDVRMILTGHTHHLYAQAFQGLPYITNGSTLFLGEQKEEQVVFLDQTYCGVLMLDKKVSYRVIHLNPKPGILVSVPLSDL
ncbi:MAG: metallophosphoesterase [Erysipelotrichaceae bacterium]|nr:metallophosphoesterase [Erysipelotrichaceae bacterium]